MSGVSRRNERSRASGAARGAARAQLEDERDELIQEIRAKTKELQSLAAEVYPDDFESPPK